MRTCPDCGMKVYEDDHSIAYCPQCGWEDVKTASQYNMQRRRKNSRRFKYAQADKHITRKRHNKHAVGRK